MITGISQIAAERHRQQHEEGWTAEHDDQHTHGELAAAAACYLAPERNLWPFERRYYKPSGRIYSLVKAGALIAAELDRLERAQQ